MVSGGMKVIKYLLFFFNLIFWITGAFILGLGIYVQVKFSHFFIFVGTNFLSAPILLIVVGAIITIIAFFGCCGAAKENHCMTITFSVLLGLIFVLELAAGITAYVMRKDLDNIIRDNMVESMSHYNETNYDTITKGWNAIQHDVECCGVDSYKDWEYNVSKPVPESCCKQESSGCTANVDNLYSDGCYKKFSVKAGDQIVIVGGVGVGIAFIQIIGIVCACCLASAIKREYEVV